MLIRACLQLIYLICILELKKNSIGKLVTANLIKFFLNPNRNSTIDMFKELRNYLITLAVVFKVAKNLNELFNCFSHNYNVLNFKQVKQLLQKF